MLDMRRKEATMKQIKIALLIMLIMSVTAAADNYEVIVRRKGRNL
jgi:hypothetical protein